MPIGWAIGGSALLGYLGSQNQANAATSAAQTQLQGTQYAADIQKAMFDTLNAQQAPYRTAGYNALNQINTMLPYFTAQPTAQDISSMPGYQFAVSQGEQAARQGANVLSPGSNADRAAQQFAINYTMNQALPQYMAQQTNIYNRLASLAGLGQTSLGQTTNLGSTTGTNLSQLAVGGANALAGGTVGAANAMAGGLSNIGNSAMLYSLLNKGPAAAAPTGGMSPTDYVSQYSVG
jgi:hypothetical protein